MMRGAILHAPRDIRVEQREDPKIEQPTDVIIRLAAACVCGSDLWPYRGIEPDRGRETSGDAQPVLSCRHLRTSARKAAPMTALVPWTACQGGSTTAVGSVPGVAPLLQTRSAPRRGRA